MMHRIWKFVFGALLVSSLLLCSCSEKITGQSGTVPIKIDAGLKLAISNFSRFTITVTATDIDNVSTPLTLQNGFLVGEIAVPPGLQRQFIAEAFDINNRVVYRGISTIDVIKGASIELPIFLIPVLPCFNITPHFSNSIMGNDINFDIHIWETPDMSNINFDLVYRTQAGLLIFDSLSVGDGLNGSPLISHEQVGDTVSISVFQNDLVARLVDTAGYGHLAKLYFHSHYDTPLDFDTGYLTLKINSANTVTGLQLQPDSFYINEARVIFSKDIQTGDSILVDTTWTKIFGTQQDDLANAASISDDGVFFACGQSYSPETSWDTYLVGVDSSGKTLFDNSIKRSGNNIAFAAVAIPGGGFAITGATSSSQSSENVLISFIDKSGQTVLENSIVSKDIARANAIAMTTEGNFVLAGKTGTSNSNILVAKTDPTGNVIWTKTIISNSNDEGNAVIQASDGDFVIAGVTGSQDTWEYDIVVTKVSNDSGRVIWSSTFGGAQLDWAKSIVATADGGFLICGYSFSHGAGGGDIYMLKIDNNGDFEWQKTFGGSGHERGNEIISTQDGNYIIAGLSSSLSDNNSDAYILKITPSGNKIWSTTYSRKGNDEAFGISQTVNGGYLVSGSSESETNNIDLFMIRMTASGTFEQ